MFFGGFQSEGAQVGDAAPALLVSGVEAHIETQSGFQASNGENGISRRDVAHQFTCLRIVHFHNEFLLETAVKALHAFHVQRFRRLIYNRAICERVRFPWNTIILYLFFLHPRHQIARVIGGLIFVCFRLLTFSAVPQSRRAIR